MFNKLIHNSIFRRSVASGLTVLLLLLSQTCRAAQECRFGDGNGGITTLVNSEFAGGPVRLPTPGPIYGAVTNGSFTVNLTPGIQAKCSMGRDGDVMKSLTSPEIMVGSYGGEALFATNIPGIAYAVRVKTSEGGGGYGGFFSARTVWTDLTTESETSNWDDKWINTSVLLYIGPDYKGNPDKVTMVRPKAGTLGKMGLGDPNDSNNQPWTFMVDENSFQIPIILPTCSTVMLSNGGTNVDLGDYYVSDIKNNRTRDIPFAIEVSNCTSVATFTTKLTATNVTGVNSDLLGNTLASAAEGAGVKILHDGDTQLIPNSAASAYTLSDGAIPYSKEINFIAQLVPNGSTVKPGTFKATGVFTLSYD